MKVFKNKWHNDKWIQLLCYYHYQTEMYDRSLTDMRSPYDPTEAYLWNPDIRSLSNANAMRTKSLIDRIAQTEYIPKNDNKHNELSAQGWIEQFLGMKKFGKLNWLEKYI